VGVGDAPDGVAAVIDQVPDAELAAVLQDLGGHDIDKLLTCYDAAARCADRPSVVFAYTVKGWGLPIAGDPLNHAALLTGDQIERRCERRPS
jgi:pyruvate dehydrogenase E1 component